MSDSLYIVMPAYNEADNIINTLDEWYPVILKYGNSDSRIVVMDDGSKDDTFTIMKEYAKDHPQFQPLTHENKGHGATVMELYAYALKNNADYVFQTDTDGQTDPNEFDEFWNDRGKYDMIIGWRRNREDGAARVVVTRVLRMVVRSTFHVDVTDANTPFRLMTSQSLSENLAMIPEGFNLSNVALSAIYAKRGQNVSYRKITFRPRQGGVNSLNISRICKIGMNAVSDFKTINKNVEQQCAILDAK